ncbi:steroidogenic acute regulatory protein isoform X2 [Microcaecilia unicolor]|uniref:Steroidogenic acute regulatory protein-like isoform X2 n=1 Tax=Microcaecilia unicolor TaxID=1415580 RepID=A0A6P7Y702_9AMPH|nr:steroidogenic acute regulatory protein-like isoform X2 [Microcaecilia unicolor]
MLPATFKLCCGISHEHLRQMTGVEQDGYLDSHWVSSSADLAYVKQGEATLHCALRILQQLDGWKVEVQQENGSAVQSKFLPTLGKVFRAEAVVNFPADQLHSHLFDKMEEMNDWNHVSHVEVLKRIGKDTLVTHEVVQSPGNLIGQRDFVSVHHSKRQGSAFYVVGTATCFDLMPPQKGLIRAETGLTCFVLKPLESDKKKTKFTWLLSTDLKGWIPKPIVSCAMSQTQINFINHLQRHLASSAAQPELPQEGAFHVTTV